MLKPEAAASGTINQSEPYEISRSILKARENLWSVTGFLLVVNWWKKEARDHVITFENQLKTTSQGKYASLPKNIAPFSPVGGKDISNCGLLTRTLRCYRRGCSQTMCFGQ